MTQNTRRSGVRYIEVVGWEDYQHYNDRRPPWIKLHASLWDNPDFLALSPSNKVLLIGIWSLTSTTGNGRLPYNLATTKARLGLNHGGTCSYEPLIQAGFIKVRASKPLADRYPRDRDRDRDRDRAPLPPKGGNGRIPITNTTKIAAQAQRILGDRL